MITEDTPWQKQLLVGASLLLVVGLLVGGVVAVAALKAADVAGVGETQVPDTGPPPGLGPTTETPDTTVGPKTTAPPMSAPTTPTQTPTTTTRTRRPPQPAIMLTASPLQATTYQRVSLSGTYAAVPGTSLQVQRKQGGAWADFPTTAHVNGGTFSTYIATGQAGQNPFRVVDTATGKTSNVVVVMITG